MISAPDEIWATFRDGYAAGLRALANYRLGKAIVDLAKADPRDPVAVAVAQWEYRFYRDELLTIEQSVNEFLQKEAVKRGS